MTLPYERTRAVLSVREFLLRLASPYGGGIKGIRREVREEARRLLKHYPLAADLVLPGAFDCRSGDALDGLGKSRSSGGR
jgi:hypothetical protein